MATVTYDPATADVTAITDAIDRANDLMRPEDDNAGRRRPRAGVSRCCINGDLP